MKICFVTKSGSVCRIGTMAKDRRFVFEAARHYVKRFPILWIEV